MTHIFIRDFVADVMYGDDDDIYITFEVSADEPGEFDYKLHAIFIAPDNSIADEIMLIQGYGLLNETHSLVVDTREMADKDGFMLRLTASVQHGQAAILDTEWLDLRQSVQ